MADVEVRPVRVFIAQHLVQHDGREYLAGDEFRESDAKPEEIKALRAAGAIKLREEVEAADRLAAERVALEERNRELEAQLAELRAAQSGEAPKSAKGAKVAKTPADPSKEGEGGDGEDSQP